MVIVEKSLVESGLDPATCQQAALMDTDISLVPFPSVVSSDPGQVNWWTIPEPEVEISE